MKLFKGKYLDHTDELLMAKVAKGDVRAFEMIYDKYSGPLMGYFQKMLRRDKEKAEDFVQDLFTKIVQRPELFDTSKKFKTWIYSVANNMCKNEYRKQEVRKVVVNGLDSEMSAASFLERPDEMIDYNAFGLALDKALDNLNDKHKTVFVMRFKLNLSIKEIAEIHEVSDGTIKSRIFYCIKKLNSALEMYNPSVKEKVYG